MDYGEGNGRSDLEVLIISYQLEFFGKLGTRCVLHSVLPVSGCNTQWEDNIFKLQPWFLCNSTVTTLLGPA